MVVDSLNGLNAELEGVTGVDVAVAPPALSLILLSVRLLVARDHPRCSKTLTQTTAVHSLATCLQ